MPRELKQDRAPASLDGAESARDGSRSALDGARNPRVTPVPPSRRATRAFSAERDRSTPPQWFEALDPEAAPPPPRPRPIAAIPLLAMAAILLIVLKNPLLHVTLPLALATAAGVVVYRTRRVAARAHRRLSRWRGVELEPSRVVFRAGGAPMVLVDLGASFGVTLLATPRRDRMLAILSSSAGTFYVGAAFDAAARRAFSPLLDRATIVVSDDAGLEAIGPDGEPLLLAPDELASLLDALVEHSPSCLDRFVLTDARGAELTLDGRVLSAGQRTVDLDAPLEWKPIVFQEAFGQAVAVYQGTWVRQGGTEMVLVCLLPSLGSVAFGDVDVAALDRAALRDLRLMQASPEQPPPADQRVAIDRLFMLPLRSALDRAPRPSQEQPRARV